jgi:hypothetical protein
MGRGSRRTPTSAHLKSPNFSRSADYQQIKTWATITGKKVAGEGEVVEVEEEGIDVCRRGEFEVCPRKSHWISRC